MFLRPVLHHNVNAQVKLRERCILFWWYLGLGNGLGEGEVYDPRRAVDDHLKGALEKMRLESAILVTQPWNMLVNANTSSSNGASTSANVDALPTISASVSVSAAALQAMKNRMDRIEAHPI